MVEQSSRDIENKNSHKLKNENVTLIIVGRREHDSQEDCSPSIKLV